MTDTDVKTDLQRPVPYWLGDTGTNILAQFDSFADKLEQAIRTGKPFGPVTGFEKVDRELCGAFLPGLHVVQGNTGAGKTAFCLQMACNSGCPTLYVSCELGPLELLRRITARVTKKPLHLFKDPGLKDTLSAKDMKRLVREAIATAPNLVIGDATAAYAHPDWIRDMAALIRERQDSEHLLIVIDSLHSWTDELTGDEYERLSFGIVQLRKLSADLNCPVLYIAEQNRESNRQGSKAGVNAGAGNRAIEYKAETVIGIYAEDNAQPDALGEIPVTLKFNKNRNGSPGKTVKLSFNGSIQRFQET